VLIVWILAGCLACLLALLSIPVDLAFSLQRDAHRREARGTLSWFFGLARVDLGKSGAGQEEGKPASHSNKRRQRGRGRRMSAFLRSEGCALRVLKLARDLLRRIHVRNFNLQLQLGLDDPADTGRLWAIVGPLAAMLTLLPSSRIAIEPEFTSAACDLDCNGDIRLIPIQLLSVVLLFVMSPVTLRQWYAGRKLP